jgi:hypothetical protein
LVTIEKSLFGGKYQFMNLAAMQFSPGPCCFLSLGSKYSQHPVPIHPLSASTDTDKDHVDDKGKIGVVLNITPFTQL